MLPKRKNLPVGPSPLYGPVSKSFHATITFSPECKVLEMNIKSCVRGNMPNIECLGDWVTWMMVKVNRGVLRGDHAFILLSLPHTLR